MSTLKVVNDNGDDVNSTGYNVFTVRTNRRVYQELVELRGEVYTYIHGYVYIDVNICIHECTYQRLCTYTDIHMLTYPYTYIYIYMQIDICLCIHVYMNIYKRVYMYAFNYIHILIMIYKYERLYVYT
jgi:hypothetical protein